MTVLVEHEGRVTIVTINRPEVRNAVNASTAALLADAFRWTVVELPDPGTAGRMGERIFGSWVLPFEVLSVLLLAALVGAIVLSRPDIGARPDPPAVLPAGEGEG